MNAATLTDQDVETIREALQDAIEWLGCAESFVDYDEDDRARMRSRMAAYEKLTDEKLTAPSSPCEVPHD